MFSGRINTCRPEQRFSMCCTNISLTLITLHCAIVCENFLSIISLNHPHSYLPGKSPMYVCNYNLGVLLKKKIAIKKQKSTITTLKYAKSFYNIQCTFSLTFSFSVDRKRPFFLSKQTTEVSFEYKQQLTLRPRRLRTNNCF